MADSSPPSGGSQRAGEDDPEAPPTNRRLMRSLVLASLPPFFLVSLGHYFSVTLPFVGMTVRRLHFFHQRGAYYWVFDDAREDADVFVCTQMSMAAISFVLLCFSQAAAISASATVNSGRSLTLSELFSRMGGLWRKPSVTRMYSTVLLLGYTLSLILVVVVVLLSSGGVINAWVLESLLCLLALLLCLYLGVVGSVGAGTFLLDEAGRGVEALWRAGALMEETKLQGFLVFFLSLVVAHGFLVNNGLWRDDLYRVNMAAIRLSPGPVLMNAIWMVGAGGLVRYVGVLLQV